MARLDPFDDALDDLRISGSVLLHEAYTPDWAIAVPEEAGLRSLLGVGDDKRVLAFHLVCRGGFDLSDANTVLRLDEPELSLVSGGQAHRLSVGRNARVIPLAEILAGDAPPTADMFSPDATEIVCGAFFARAAPLNPLFGALPAMMKVLTAGDNSPPALNGVTHLLAAELGRRSRNGFTTQRLLEVLLAEAIRAFQASVGNHQSGWFRGLADPRIAEALSRIHGSPSDPWSVDELAHGVALSPSRFAARFRETVGESVMGYVKRWRANVACRMLRESDLPIAEIAIRVGYESVPAFSRAFKEQVGVPPAKWRQSST